MTKNSAGFTLVEFVVAMGVAFLLSLGTVATLTMVKKQTTSATTKTEEFIDKTIAERLLLIDLKGANPSFNNFPNVLDEKGRRFFDYFPDIPRNQVSGLTKGEPDRTMILTLDSTISPKTLKDTYFLISPKLMGAPSTIVFDPVSAYAVGKAPKDLNKAATLTYQGINRNNLFSKLPGFWQPNQLYMLTTAAFFSATSAPSSITPSRSPVYVGLARGNDLNHMPQLASYIDFRMPWMPTSAFRSADDFLRRLPPTGGAQPVVHLRLVQLVRYSLEPMPKKPQLARFYREVWTPQGFKKKFLISNKVRAVRFLRSDVTAREISFSVE